MKIGHLVLDNNIILAPMAGITDLPYRRIMKHFGAGLVFTEMVSANGLIRAGKRTRELLHSTPEERPLGIQLFGENPEVLASAAELVQKDSDLLDLNLGCPVNNVVRSGAVRQATTLPLTIKLRSGWDNHSINFLEVARIAVEEGVDAVTLHPRTRSQGFSGHADWRQIRQLKEILSVPVIGSGDLFTAANALAMLEQTGCDAVMIGRGSYGNPWLIRDILALQRGKEKPPAPTLQERLETATLHLELLLESFGAKKTVPDMRRLVCWYSRGLPGAATFRALANRAQSVEKLKEIMAEFFSSAPDLLRSCHE
jgi:tRNA-dihydrouridine synthase